jgi:hypothetical protein
VQRTGLRLYGPSASFPAYRLAQLGHAPVETRRRADNRDIEFASRPFVGDCLIFSGTADPGFTGYRLGQELASPFADYRFAHPGTRWYNIASPIGARKYFARHAPQVLDFFAGLVARRAAEGKRVLLVAKKAFVRLCAAGLADRLAGLGVDLEIVSGGWTESRLSEARTVPLITYGMIGSNLFEYFDAAYCLTGYYVDEEAVNHGLQDAVRLDLRLPIRVETTGNPPRRRAAVADPAHRDYDVARLAQAALEHQEHDVVVQAVGRVRPFTRPGRSSPFRWRCCPG